MSNPGVITLVDASSRFSKIKRFVVEDNIGESIHVHIDNMRIDFTVNEYLEFSNATRDALEELNIIPGYSLEKFDEHFLMEFSSHLYNLIDIKTEKIKLSKLRCIVNYDYYKGGKVTVKRILPVYKTPVYKYLVGDKVGYEKYNQYNYHGVNNCDRIDGVLSSIKENGYPYKEQYIILANGQNIIRDGQHRAAVLYDLYGCDHEIEIMRFNFKGKRHYVRVFAFNVYRITKWFLRMVYMKSKRPFKFYG